MLRFNQTSGRNHVSMVGNGTSSGSGGGAEPEQWGRALRDFGPRPHRQGAAAPALRRRPPWATTTRRSPTYFECHAAVAEALASRVFPGRPRTSVTSCSRRTRSSSAAATPRTCSPCGACMGSTRFCARRGSRGSCSTAASAGMICWFEAGVTDSFGPQLEGIRTASASSPGAPVRTTTARSSGGRATASSSTAGSRRGVAAEDGVGSALRRHRAPRGRHLPPR